jgi:HEAT repeat protein
MTHREIALHLGAAAALFVLGVGAYWTFHSAYAVPGLIRLLQGEDPKARRHAAASLARLGAPAKPAVEELRKQARLDRKLNDRTSAVGALVEISPSAAHGLIPVYIEALHHTDPRVRYEAAMVLAELGPVGKEAVPPLVATARDPNELVRRWAVTALGRIGVASAEVRQTLVAALADSEVVRHDALLVYSYGFLPREALQQAAPSLRRLGEDKRYAARVAAALRPLEQPFNPAIELQVHGQGLKADGPGRRYALQKLARLGPAAVPALPAIVAVLNDPRPLHRYLAIETLAAIGPGAASSVPALRERLNDEEALVRAAAADAIAAISGSPASTAARETP